MRIAALYDIHGNLPALEAVLSEIERENVDLIVVGGDIVAGPLPNECLDRLRSVAIPTQCIHGNGESETIRYLKTGVPGGITPAGDESARWVGDQLTAEHQTWIASWPTTVHVNVQGLGEILFCHATPHDDVTIFTRLTGQERLASIFEGTTADLVVCGHVHIQGDEWQIGETRVVRAGSIGMPYGQTGAAWLLIDSEDGLHYRHTPYDLEAAAAAVRQTSYPGAASFADNNILSVPPADKALEMISALEAKQIAAG